MSDFIPNTYYRAGAVWCDAICKGVHGHYDRKLGYGFEGVSGYCLDAPTEIPAGSVKRLRYDDEPVVSFTFRSGV